MERAVRLNLKDRYAGSLAGLASGDAVGTTVEFRSRGTFAPVTDMVGGGPFDLAPGQWTDDTSMALCLAESLLAQNGFDARDQMGRYLNWWVEGYLSSTGECFDIGMTVRGALERFQRTGEPYSGSTDPHTAGNGSLMRLAPVVLFFFPRLDQVVHFSAASSRTTHGAPEAVECCKLLAYILTRCLAGLPKDEVLNATGLVLQQPNVANLAAAGYTNKTQNMIRGTGYAVASLEAALWCFSSTSDFESAVLTAANLGDDADTTAAIVGQVAGAFYGLKGIPKHWLERLHRGDQILSTAEALYAAATDRSGHENSLLHGRIE
jgi:ADP-ribosyl-[dinitrogen reductase] hydrolase